MTDRGLLLTDLDLHLLGDGSHFDLHAKLGAHVTAAGVVFAVWAPNALAVRVVGDWEGWNDGLELKQIGRSGVWEGLAAEARVGDRYKLLITTAGSVVEKADPFARASELPPGNASIVTTATHVWEDGDWLAGRGVRHEPTAALSIYELHLGSWRPGLGYRDVAAPLADHVERLGFTHVQLLPVMEHPFTGSWGYQVTGFFSPTARFGSPDDLRFLVDQLHRRGIGVILDWVPAHFPDDPHGLARFDGTALYEHDDPRQGRHPDWGSLIFNYGRNEVRSFLISSATYWLDEFHADGLRVDAVASMLYLDYSRGHDEWVPNRYGGRENIEAIDFLRRFTDEVRSRHPDVLVVAEESTAWPGVTSPTAEGGLGFTHKWDMGWMHDTLRYLERAPIHRCWHQDDLTFRGLYVGSERWVLPLSHDEVVHGKGSLLTKMPGDPWQMLANLRLLYGYQAGVPGAKLLFMGGELAQPREWDHDGSVSWELLDDPAHAGVAAWVTALNRLYRESPSLVDDPGSFQWLGLGDAEKSVVTWARWSRDGSAVTVWAANFTPAPQVDYRVGVPSDGTWRLVLNGDAGAFGGSDHAVEAEPVTEESAWHGQEHSVVLTLPPLAIVVYERLVTQ